MEQQKLSARTTAKIQHGKALLQLEKLLHSRSMAALK